MPTSELNTKNADSLFPMPNVPVTSNGANTDTLRCLGIDYRQTQKQKMHQFIRHFLIYQRDHSSRIYSPRSSKLIHQYTVIFRCIFNLSHFVDLAHRHFPILIVKCANYFQLTSSTSLLFPFHVQNLFSVD